jgi:hypothetical protein
MAVPVRARALRKDWRDLGAHVGGRAYIPQKLARSIRELVTNDSQWGKLCCESR